MTETIKAKAEPKAEPKARVLKAGDGKISKGFREEGVQQFFSKGDEVSFPPEIAAELEARGYIDIQ